MLARVISALVGIPLFVFVCHRGVAPFAFTMAAIAALGAWEIRRAHTARGIAPNPLLLAAGPAIALIPALDALHVPDLAALVQGGGVLVMVVAVVWELVRVARTGELHLGQNLAYGLLCGAYTAMFGAAGWLRSAFGFEGAMAVVCMVWATDVAALYTGKALGRHRLAPLLSPGKTVEGSIGGIAAAMVCGAVAGTLLGHPPAAMAGAGAIVSVFGQAGDLYKSAIKREAGIKDFGAIMPGHGGAIDRFDSLIFVATVLWGLAQFG